MKKKLIYLIFMLFILVTGCDKTLERYPLDSPSAATFYTNDIEIQGGVNACYRFIVAGNNGYFAPEFSYDALAETVFIRGGGFALNVMMSVLDFKEGHFRTLCLNMYQGIAQCNLMLQKIEENKNALTADKIKQYQGEIYFLRANYYLRLTNMFGDVVYVDKPVVSIGNGKSVTRSSRSEVVKKIYSDFDQSYALLTGSTVKTLGRIAAGAATTYKARAAVQNNDWAVAAAVAKIVIDSKQYTLMPKYSTLFTEAILNSSGNTEQILTNMHLFAANNATAFPLYTSARSAGGYTTIVPTHNMLDSYQCTDGLDISKSLLYDKTKPYDCVIVSCCPETCGMGTSTKHGQINLKTLNDKGQFVKNFDSYASTVYTSFTGYLVRK